MADTIPGVTWKLVEIDSGSTIQTGFLHPIGSSVLTTALGVELLGAVRANFPVTHPIWYGLWIESPLSLARCRILFQLCERVGSITNKPFSRTGKVFGLSEFQTVLGTVLSDDGKRYRTEVSLHPPGHFDFDVYTTFPHCPRCKAEADLPRWSSPYPTEAMDCRVCGNRFIPAETYKMNAQWRSGVCDSCGVEVAGESLSEEQYGLLREWQVYRSFVKEAEEYDTPGEIMRRLTGRSLYSPAHRRPWVRAQIKEYAERLGDRQVSCPVCHIGHLFFPGDH